MLSFRHLSPYCAFVQVKIPARDIFEQFLHSQIFTGGKKGYPDISGVAKLKSRHLWPNNNNSNKNFSFLIIAEGLQDLIRLSSQFQTKTDQ